MKKYTKRAIGISLLIIIFWCAGLFIISNLKDNMEFYFTPTQVKEQYDNVSQKKVLRVGGLVVKGSLMKNPNNTSNFVITDSQNEVKVIYNGSSFPPIFKEGVGVICRGYLDSNGVFISDQLIGKHDENYMPPKSESR
jgi:cytochrome c-type biogenesis protein CcmE